MTAYRSVPITLQPLPLSCLSSLPLSLWDIIQYSDLLGECYTVATGLPRQIHSPILFGLWLDLVRQPLLRLNVATGLSFIHRKRLKMMVASASRPRL